MKKETKKGISLIVLVITIIVIIILAVAVILSIANNNPIENAKKARQANDDSTLKEYVNTLRANWELMSESEREINAPTSGTFAEYANNELDKNNYTSAVVEGLEDGSYTVHTKVSESAKTAVKEGIKVGDTVTGYTLAENTYTTSGNENTAPSETEQAGTKQTLKTDTTVTWKYIGIGEDGSLEIAANIPNKKLSDLAADYKMTLSGKGGYLNGPAELDKACAALYSVDGKGTAKSMNIDHVTRLLGYTGAKGGYYSRQIYDWVDTITPLTIGEIVSSKGEISITGETPDGKDINTYKADFFPIYKTSSAIKNTGNKELVYPTNTSMYYWLASPCVNVDFYDGCAGFGVRCVVSFYVSLNEGFSSISTSYCNAYAVRPVVSLLSNVKLEREGETWIVK